MKKTGNISKTSHMHGIKLIARSVLFVSALTLYIIGRIKSTDKAFGDHESLRWLLAVIWLVYAVEMLLRFFPSKIESPGCQKQFAKNYQPTVEDKPLLQPWKRTLAVAAVWFMLNAVIGVLYMTELIDAGMLVLISLAYGVCDMICILFFCPFQTWFMKNRCCTDCRIYNWDFAMMFTPYLFIPGLYTWSLLGMALLLLLRWEITLRRHPERFAANTNAGLSCKNCSERLCSHKKQLMALIRDGRILRG